MCNEIIKVTESPRGSGIYISSYAGNYEKFTIPEIIQGKKVCGISAFAFSEHRELVELNLPETMEYVGAHAFYNCRALRCLVLGDGISDIGDGAFKNCYGLSEIKLRRRGAHMKCLKGILSEVNNEVTVTVWYEDGMAQVVFPYYLYNYEENTPARIVNQITEGAGIQYRECIGGDDIHYMDYDDLFEAGVHLEVQDASWRIAACRLRYPYRLSDRARQRYRAFLHENRIAVITELLKREDDQGLKDFLALGLLKKEDFRDCIDAARCMEQMEGLGILLACQKDKYGFTKKRYEF